MNDPDWRDIRGSLDGDVLSDLEGDEANRATQQQARDLALQQLTDYWADHVYDAAHDALSGFCGDETARKLAGEIVARLRGKMEGQDE